MLSNCSKSMVTAAFVVAVLSVSASAFAGNTKTYTDECYFPGVDYYGCLDWRKGDCLCTKVCVNKKNCKVTVTAKGYVENCSGKNQCYRNSVEPGCWWARFICFQGSTYKVNKKGCANYSACGELKCRYDEYDTYRNEGSAPE